MPKVKYHICPCFQEIPGLDEDLKLLAPYWIDCPFNRDCPDKDICPITEVKDARQ